MLIWVGIIAALIILIIIASILRNIRDNIQVSTNNLAIISQQLAIMLRANDKCVKLLREQEILSGMEED